MYACTDSQKLYEDVNNTVNGRIMFAATTVATEIYRQYSIRPEQGKFYYVWETNTLYLYNSGWIIVIGSKATTSSDTYYSSGTGVNSINGCCLNNNGLLNDGSVVVRDPNGLIKGKLYIDQETNELTVSSFLGGGIKFFPYGSTDELGSLYLNPVDVIDENGNKKVIPNDGILRFIGSLDIRSIDNTDSYITKTTGKYKIYTEEDFTVGEWELSSQDIIDKLNSYETQPLPINVNEFGGKTVDKFSLVGHKHVYSDITNLTDYTDLVLKTRISGTNGIVSSYNSNLNKLQISANNFVIGFSGGASGNGTVRGLSDTNIELDIDPEKHIHRLETIDGWSEFESSYNAVIEGINDDIDTKVDKSSVITTPRVPLSGEKLILALNSEGNLSVDIDGNANTADKLSKSVTISLTSGVTGSATFDGSKNISITTTVDPSKHSHEQYILKERIGIDVAPLDTNGRIPTQNLPDSILGSLQYQGTFDPSNGLPSTSPVKGQYWVSQGSGTILGHDYEIGDWIIYNGTEWEYLDNGSCVQSVNGQTGVVEITPESIGAIPTTDIFNIDDPKVDTVVKTVVDSVTGEIVLPIGIQRDKLPTATDSELGMVKIGQGLDIDTSGTISVLITEIDDGELS